MHTRSPVKPFEFEITVSLHLKMLFTGQNAYKVGRYRADSKQNYVMEPKTGLGLEPLSIEVKVNPADLPKIRILDPSKI
jgi:hypothetical protein